jgi:CheY-like chemotaxis protein
VQRLAGVQRHCRAVETEVFEIAVLLDRPGCKQVDVERCEPWIAGLNDTQRVPEGEFALHAEGQHLERFEDADRRGEVELQAARLLRGPGGEFFQSARIAADLIDDRLQYVGVLFDFQDDLGGEIGDGGVGCLFAESMEKVDGKASAGEMVLKIGMQRGGHGDWSREKVGCDGLLCAGHLHANKFARDLGKDCKPRASSQDAHLLDEIGHWRMEPGGCWPGPSWERKRGRSLSQIDAGVLSRRILVVDDNQDAAKMQAMLLKLMGHQTHLAHDGAEALAVAEREKPDLVLLDVGLPKMTGHEVCRAIRQQAWGEEMVLIAITGWGEEEDRRQSQEAGFNGHLVKPVEPDALRQLIADVASGAKTGWMA